MKRLLAALGLALLSLAPATFAQAPATAPDPAKEELRAYLDGYMSWGKGQVSLVDLVEHKVPGWRLVRAVKKFEGREGDGEQLEAALDDAGKTALIGIVFVDEERAGKDMPVATARDLEGVSTSLKKIFGPTRFKLSLDPSTDVPGWKGARIGIDTGYGFYEAPAHVSAHDGGFVVLGRVWERSRSIPDQRRALIPLTDTPFIGDADAKITVVEYSDMQCPSCKFRTAMWEKLTEKLGSAVKIKRYFKSYPLTSIHSWAFRAASAGRCFFEKDPALFLSWKGAVYGRQEQLSVDALDAFAFDFAQSNGTTSQDFLSCYLQPAATNRILKDLGEGFGMGVRSTPTYFVDGVLVTWWDEDTMEEFLRTKYMNSAGLPLPKKPKPTVQPTPSGRR
jgi:protein-disulfide isomerase